MNADDLRAHLNWPPPLTINRETTPCEREPQDRIDSDADGDWVALAEENAELRWGRWAQ